MLTTLLVKRIYVNNILYDFFVVVNRCL